MDEEVTSILQHYQRLLQGASARLLETTGGSLADAEGLQIPTPAATSFPTDVLLNIATSFACPKCLFAWQACCVLCRKAILSRRTWAGRQLPVICSEDKPSLSDVCRLFPLWGLAACILIPETCLAHGIQPLVWPQNLRIHWGLRPRPVQQLTNVNTFLWESDFKLFGHADMQCSLDPRARCLVIGVQTTGPAAGAGFRKTNCRIENPFKEDMRVDFTLIFSQNSNSNRAQMALPHTATGLGRSICVGQTHRIALRWSATMMEMTLDDQRLYSATYPLYTPRPGAHAKITCRVFAPVPARVDDFAMESAPSEVMQDCIVTCSRCFCSGVLLAGPCWRCNSCGEWFCPAHSRRGHRDCLCVRCSTLRFDIAGGASSSGPAEAASAMKHYVDGAADSDQAASATVARSSASGDLDTRIQQELDAEAAAIAKPWRRAPEAGDLLGGAATGSDGLAEVVGDHAPADHRRIAVDISQATPREEEGEVAEGHVSQAADCFIDDMERLLEELPQDSERLTRARKRSELPGAATTLAEFAASFQDQSSAAAASIADAIPFPDCPETSITDHVASVRNYILGKSSALPPVLVRLATAAISVYRLRLTDMHTREHVLLLWIVEGNDHMRCHSGNLYLYSYGAFSLHRGVPPQGTLARCKKFLLQLEGLFRLLPPERLRNDEHVSRAVEKVFDEHNRCIAELLAECENAAQSRSGGPRVELGAPSDSVNAVLADALSKVGLSMQRQLLEDKIFNLVVEWCDTPQTKRPGCSYKDCAVLYDDSPDLPVRFVPCSPDNNIYLHIPFPLRDPVLAEASDRLDRFYSQTFWMQNEVTCLCVKLAAAFVSTLIIV